MTQEKPQGFDPQDSKDAHDLMEAKDAVAAAVPLPAEMSPEAYRDSIQASPEDSSPSPSDSKQGVGFLGRRGTAPINVASPSVASPSVAAPNAGTPDAAAKDTTPTAAKAKASPQQLPPKPGMAENAFSLMSYAGLLFLAALLALQTAAGIYFPSVFLPQEAALAEVYELMSRAGQWLAPPATATLPAALPGYLWFMGGLDMIPGLPDPFLLPVAAALAALAGLLGTYMLGICTGLGGRVSFAAGLLLLSALGFVPLTHWVGPDLLLAGLLALSLACLYRGWTAERAFLWMGAGFVLAGAGVLTGGLPALWIPLLGSLLFILWRVTLRRGHRLDAVLGFGLLIACIAGWLGAVILLTGESAAMLAPLVDQMVSPLLPPLWPPKDPWWLGLALLGVSLIPWIFIPLFVSWNRVAAEAWPSLKASRKEKAGIAWLWICLACGVALLLISSAKPWLMAVPLLPLAALLLAKALLNLSHTGSRLFFLLLALLCLVAGAVLSAAGIPAALSMLEPHIPASMAWFIPWAAQSAGLPLLGGILLLTALTLTRFTNRAYPGGALAVFVLMTTMLVQPATLLTAPSHAGRLAVHLPKGMGMGVLPGVTPQMAPEPEKEPVQTEPAPTDAAPAVPSTPVEQPTSQTTGQPVEMPAQDAVQPRVEPAPAPTPTTPSEPVAKPMPELAPELTPVPAPERAPERAPTAPTSDAAPAPTQEAPAAVPQPEPERTQQDTLAQ